MPGKSAVDEQLGYCDVAVPPARHPAGAITRDSFASARRRRTVEYAIAYPPGVPAGTGLPVCLVLHGYGADALGALAAGNYPGYLADAVAAGTPPFALAAASGGNGYWHPHPDDDPLGMLLYEFLPLLAQHRLHVDRPAVLGYSMGGFGALLCGLAAPGRFASIIASSPAFWRSYDEARARQSRSVRVGVRLGPLRRPAVAGGGHQSTASTDLRRSGGFVHTGNSYAPGPSRRPGCRTHLEGLSRQSVLAVAGAGATSPCRRRVGFDLTSTMAPGRGLEPLQLGPKPSVLPLDDPGWHKADTTSCCGQLSVAVERALNRNGFRGRRQRQSSRPRSASRAHDHADRHHQATVISQPPRCAERSLGVCRLMPGA